MTRKDILKKYGFSWMSNVNLKEELSEQAAAEFVRACDELKTELEKTRMYKRITRLLDWLAEKIE